MAALTAPVATLFYKERRHVAKMVVLCCSDPPGCRPARPTGNLLLRRRHSNRSEAITPRERVVRRSHIFPGLRLSRAERSFSTYSNYYTPVQPAQAAAEEQEEPVRNAAPAMLEVRVPANAKLWVEDGKTHQDGAVRSFISPELQPGKAFTYTIRAHWISTTGEVVDETRQVKVLAGRRTMVDFLNP